MNIEKEVIDFVLNFRKKVEPGWGEDTVYENFVRDAGDEAISSGNCGPTSILLIRSLKAKFPKENFSVAVGRVHKGNTEFIKGKHVWVVWRRGTASSWVIDATADQSIHFIDPVIIESMDELAKKGVYYQAQVMARSEVEIDDSPKQRAEILSKKIELS